ncbi:MAG: hypothetical protein WBE44_01915 [Terriglobales bacterium]|jgi:hypothetical protein
MASEAPALDVSLKEQKEIIETYAKLREAEAKLIGPDGKAEILPNNLYSSSSDCCLTCEPEIPSPSCKAVTS